MNVDSTTKPFHRASILAAISIFLGIFTFLGAHAVPASATLRSSHHNGGSSATHSKKRSKYDSSLTRGLAIDSRACESVAHDMRQAADGDVTKSDAQSFARSTATALKEDKTANELKLLNSDGRTFLRSFDRSEFNPVPRSMIQGCASSTIRSPLLPTGTPANSNETPSTASLISTLQAFFANGCNGGCSDTSAPPSEFSVTFDPHNVDWAMWTINDPNLGTAAGFYEKLNGAWQVVAGPGSADVGCPGGGGSVPADVLSDFGITCPGAVSTTPTPSTVPVSSQLQRAYQLGYAHGSTTEAAGQLDEQTACGISSRTYAPPSNPLSSALDTQYLSGCDAGYQAG
jgi:hypothetical protein